MIAFRNSPVCVRGPSRDFGPQVHHAISLVRYLLIMSRDAKIQRRRKNYLKRIAVS